MAGASTRSVGWAARSASGARGCAAAAAFLAFNYLFLPPYHTLVVADPLDWLVLLVFLATSLVATQLLYRANATAEAATQRAAEVDRLAALGAETLSAPGAEEFIPPSIGVWLPPERTFSTASRRGEFRPERVDHIELAAERPVVGDVLVGVRAFRQRAEDQIVTLFGVAALDEAAKTTRVAIDKQVSQSAEVQALVEALEQQYDSYSRSQEDPLVDSDDQLPSADELGAELEKFLAEQFKGDGPQG